jgi:spore germination protein YaaH
MAYDFHRSSSTVAGPVAPLFGGKKEWDSDISEHLQAFLDSVPSEKILLGIPFYGYEWQTTSREAQAHTFPESGSTASFKRVQNLLQEKETLKVQEHWNEAALSPYISYEEDGEIYVVYYENSRSISYKLDFVNQLDLAGVAIWALGYEGDSRELWDVINRKIAL